MKKAPSFLLAGLAASAMFSASPAMAQTQDLDPAAVEAASRYALPLAFDAYVVTCSAELSPSGYAVSNADRLRAKFAEGSDAAWPAAKQAMITMAAGSGEEDMSGLFDMMGDDAVRSFMDAMVGSLVAQEIKLEDCGTIERGLEILDPMPADNVAQMIGFIVEMGQRDEAAQDDGEWNGSE